MPYIGRLRGTLRVVVKGGVIVVVGGVDRVLIRPTGMFAG
jgi:hypothetical protein